MRLADPHWGSGSKRAVTQLGSRRCSAACARHTCPGAIVPTADHCPDTAGWLSKEKSHEHVASSYQQPEDPATFGSFTDCSYKGKCYSWIPPKFQLQRFSLHYGFNTYHDALGSFAAQPTATPRQAKVCMNYNYYQAFYQEAQIRQEYGLHLGKIESL